MDTMIPLWSIFYLIAGYSVPEAIVFGVLTTVGYLVIHLGPQAFRSLFGMIGDWWRYRGIR